MANEAILVYELEAPIQFTCADNTAITKGTVLKLTDPATASASSADNDVFLGIAAADKIANDGNTKIPVYLRGIFRMVASATATTVGKNQVIKGANTIGDYTTLDGELGYVIGKALETAASGETGLVLVGRI
jgi:hypothetical protein